MIWNNVSSPDTKKRSLPSPERAETGTAKMHISNNSDMYNYMISMQETMNEMKQTKKNRLRQIGCIERSVKPLGNRLSEVGDNLNK